MKTLFDTISLGNLTLKNRFVLAPMARSRVGLNQAPNDLMALYYHQRTSAGLLITEATAISKQGTGWKGFPGIFTDEMIAGWQKVTQKAASTNTPIFLQLWHCGRLTHSLFHNGRLPVSASGIKIQKGNILTPLGKKPYETPHALTTDEIKSIISTYKTAALNAKMAGFSGVEIHAANGYLINQFLDSRTNLRNDSYGGSIENKYLFLKQVTEAVLEIWAPDQVGVRISPNGVFNEMGSHDYKETYLYTAEKLNALNLGYLHVMDGLDFGFHQKGDPMTLSEFKPVFNGLIIGNCGYTKESAQKKVADNAADLVAFGRLFISNPDLPERFKNNYPLNPCKDTRYWYTPGSKGYTDYKPYRS